MYVIDKKMTHVMPVHYYPIANTNTNNKNTPNNWENISD